MKGGLKAAGVPPLRQYRVGRYQSATEVGEVEPRVRLRKDRGVADMVLKKSNQSVDDFQLLIKTFLPGKTTEQRLDEIVDKPSENAWSFRRVNFRKFRRSIPRSADLPTTASRRRVTISSYNPAAFLFGITPTMRIGSLYLLYALRQFRPAAHL